MWNRICGLGYLDSGESGGWALGTCEKGLDIFSKHQCDKCATRGQSVRAGAHAMGSWVSVCDLRAFVPFRSLHVCVCVCVCVCG